MKIELGMQVRDTITGCKGIAITRSIWLQGCNRIGIQDKAKEDGKLPEIIYVDEPQLEILSGGIKLTLPDSSNPPGGPSTVGVPK